jgi:copper resistance protein B
MQPPQMQHPQMQHPQMQHPQMQHPQMQHPQMQMQQQKTVRFSNDIKSRDNGGRSNKKGHGSEKEKELNSKYEEMMLARQMMDKARIPERI